MWLLVVIWCIAAWRAAQPAQEKSEAKEPDLHPDDLADLLWELAGDRKGVHLSQVAQQLTKETPGRTWSVKDVRRLMEAAGIPRATASVCRASGWPWGSTARTSPAAPPPPL